MSIRRLALGALVVSGCDDEKQGVTFETGLEASKIVEALSREEATQFCEALDDAKRRVLTHEKLCVLRLVLRADDEAACREALPACVADLDRNFTMLGVGPTVPDCGLLGEGARHACPVTVGALEDCYAQALALARVYVDQFSCADAGDLNTLTAVEAGAPDDAADMPACAPIAERCPGLFEMQVPTCVVESQGVGPCCELTVDGGTMLGACLDGMCTNGAVSEPGC